MVNWCSSVCFLCVCVCVCMCVGGGEGGGGRGEGRSGPEVSLFFLYSKYLKGIV